MSILNDIKDTTHFEMEAYHWPRLINPPLKRGGHVIMDVCSSSGELILFVLFY
jgi:ribosomal protein RSM22 (predicted rRNA methylase)